MHEIAYDAAIETFESLPKARRRDPRRSRRRSSARVRAAIAGNWQKKPMCLRAGADRGMSRLTRRRTEHGGIMIGRLNHVAIAVGDIAKASSSTATRSAPRCRRRCRSRITA